MRVTIDFCMCKTAIRACIFQYITSIDDILMEIFSIIESVLATSCVRWVVETQTVLGLFICIHMPMEITIGAH